MIRRLLLVSVCLCVACGEPDGSELNEISREGAEAQREGAEGAAAPDPAPDSDPDPDSDSDSDSDPASDMATLQGCDLSAPIRVFGGDAWTDIAPSAEGFVVVGVSRLGDGEHAFAVSVAAGRLPRLIARRAVSADAVSGHRRSAPAVAVFGDRAAFAFTDGAGHLQLAYFAVGGVGPLRFAPAGEGGSLQFAPAVAWRGDQILLAWTDQRDGHRRVFVTRVRGLRAGDPVDVTPPSGAASAPSFVAGAPELSLVFIDAREAMSVLHRLDASGDTLGAVEVARPLSLLTNPPAAAVVSMAGSEWVVYTGIGSAATTAVGLVALNGSRPPVAVVPGTGYGVLTLDAEPFGAGALIAAEAPSDGSPGPAGDREAHLRTFDASGALGDPIVVRGPRGTASRVRLAVDGTTVGLAFTDRDGAYVAIGRCAAP